MRKLLFITALATSGLVTGCSKSDQAEATPAKAEEVASMTVDEVDQGVANKTVQAVDCNHPKLRKKLGVVPGAILVGSPDDYPATDLPADKGAKLVFYCADPG
jgi:hypothetical protein